MAILGECKVPGWRWAIWVRGAHPIVSRLRLAVQRVPYGGRALAAGSKVTAIERMPPKSRVVIMRWESMEQLQAWRESSRYKEARKIGDQYAASVRAFAVEG